MVFKKKLTSIEIARRSAAELLACVVRELFPQAQPVQGDLLDTGFYYDVVFPQPFKEEGLALLEERMRLLIKDNLPVKGMEMMRKNAAEFLLHLGFSLLAQEAEAAEGELVTLFHVGNYYGLCPFPHVAHLGDIGAVKLLTVESTSAFLSTGEEIAVTRIKGTACADRKSLKAFLKAMEKGKKRDHRQLGQELNLFSASEEVGSGLWVWHPKGAILRDRLLDWWRAEHQQQQFQFLSTPRLMRLESLEKTGFFRSSELSGMLFPSFIVDGSDYVLAPSSSPLHALAFKARLHSYRELPVRYAECAEVYRLEKRAQLRGLFKARASLADEASLFCTPQQVRDELISSLQFIDRTLRIFGFTYRLYLHARGEASLATTAAWEQAVKSMTEALEMSGFPYEEEPSESAGHGPCIEARLRDSLEREWSGPYIQVNLNYPERMALRYQAADDTMQRPVMISRSLFGTLERFVGLLTEHYAGQFPLWIAPEQVRVVPIADAQNDYAAAIAGRLTQEGFRVATDNRREPLAGKIYAAEYAKVPYVVVIGKEEEHKQLLTLRVCQNKQVLSGVALESLLERLHKEDGIEKLRNFES